MSDVWGGERLIGNTIVRHLREVGGSVGGLVEDGYILDDGVGGSF